jgi:hypothetical protein
MRFRLGLVALLGLLPVAPILAWSYGLGSFRAWFLLVSLPSLSGLAVAAWRWVEMRPRMAAGAAGGVLGVIGYDVFRVPFVVGGLRLLAPIDSYGVLALGAHRSSGLSAFTGWAYHLSNGVGFGIAYAMVMYGRRRWWGVVWGFVLESATVLTPFATIYGLRGKWDLIGLAYAAHIFYGLPLGYVVEQRLALPSLRMIGTAVVGLAVWLHPWAGAPAITTIRDGRFSPEWIRVRRGGCVGVRNTEARDYSFNGALLPADSVATVCFEKEGVIRVRLTGEPYSGGFVIVERGRPP